MTPSDPGADPTLSVLVVNTAFAPDLLGGAERSVGELTDSLRDMGHRVVVACLGRRDDISSDESVRRIPSRAFEHLLQPSPSAISKAVWHITELARVSTALRLRRIIREVRPDVIHFNNLAGFGWLAWLVARHIPTVQTMRDYSLLCTSATGQHGDKVCNSTHPRCRILKLPYKLKLLRPSVAVAVSNYTATRHLSSHVIDRSYDVGTVYNSPAPSIAGAHKETGDSRSRPVVGFIGRVALDKGVGVLLEAFARLPRDHRPRLVLAGPGNADDLSFITSTYSSMLTDGDVQLTGPIDAAEFFRRTDIVAVPTQWHEPFGRVAAEALRTGNALLYSRAGGLSEVVELYGGRASGISAFREPNAWRDALVRALEGHFDIDVPERAGPPDPAVQYVRAYRTAIGRTKEPHRQ